MFNPRPALPTRRDAFLCDCCGGGAAGVSIRPRCHGAMRWRRRSQRDAGVFQSTPALPRGDATSAIADAGQMVSIRPALATGRCCQSHDNPQDWKNSFNPRPAVPRETMRSNTGFTDFKRRFQSPRFATGRCGENGLMNRARPGVSIHAPRCHGAMQRRHRPSADRQIVSNPPALPRERCSRDDGAGRCGFDVSIHLRVATGAMRCAGCRQSDATVSAPRVATGRCLITFRQ